MNVRCHRDCYDSNSRKFYERGKEYDVERDNPLAKYFDFPPVAAATSPKPKVRKTDEDFLK